MEQEVITEEDRISNLPFSLPKLLKEILEGFKTAVHKKNQSIVIVIDGKSGLGKTTLSGQVGKYCDPSFNLEKVFFTPEDFMKGLTKAKKGDVLVFDEAMLLTSRSAMSKLNKMIIIAMSMMRSKNIIIIFNINSIFDLDKNLALYRADLLLHVYSTRLTERGRFCAFFKSFADQRDRIKELYLNGKKYYSYSRPKSNFQARFSSYFVLNDEEYEMKKQVGVNSFLEGADRHKHNKDKHSRDLYIRYLSNNTDLTQEQIAELGDVSPRTVWNALNKMKYGDEGTEMLGL